jgi:hypothetical protein
MPLDEVGIVHVHGPAGAPVGGTTGATICRKRWYAVWDEGLIGGERASRAG